MGKFYFTGFRRISLAFTGLFIISSLISCKKTDLVPSYIHIDKIDITTAYEIFGSNSSKITDAWVYVDGDLQGIYELPATFPILATGQHTIMIRPGIKLNGIAMSRAYYPFYEPYETTVDLVAEQIDTINPSVTYYANKIHWMEDFETAGVSLVKFSVSDTNFIQTQDSTKVFEGLSSGIASLDATYDYVCSVSDDVFDIPQDQSAVFLELNYKTSVPLGVGMYAVLSTGQNEKIETMIINPNTSWNKIYINLTYSANVSSNTTGFRIYFEAYKPDTLATAEILLDNIKLLYTE